MSSGICGGQVLTLGAVAQLPKDVRCLLVLTSRASRHNGLLRAGRGINNCHRHRLLMHTVCPVEAASPHRCYLGTLLHISPCIVCCLV